MKQQNHYNEALAYLRDFCLRHGRLMHYDRGAMLEAEGTAARLFGYVESGSFRYLVRRSASCKVTLGSSKNYEGGESTVESVAAGDLVGRSNLVACQSKNYPSCLDGDAAPTSIVAVMPSAVYVVDGADLERHYHQSPAAERMGRDFLAYRLGQVKSHIYSHYCEKGVRDV